MTITQRLKCGASLMAVLGVACAGPVRLPGDDTLGQLAVATHNAASGSKLSVDAKGHDLLYTTTYGHPNVYVYTYPSGKKVGTLSGFSYPGGLCTDAGGDVFVVDSGAEQIFEYAHGGTTRLRTLDDYGNGPFSCAVDPTTGNIAVTGGGYSSAMPNVAIYQSDSSSPTIYIDSTFQTLVWCTYDSSGNLFISPDPYAFENDTGYIAELPAGGNALINIFVSDSLVPRGGIQWDGKYVVIGNPAIRRLGPSTFLQVAISGSSATVVGTLTLYAANGRKDKNPGQGNEFWLSGNRIVADVNKHSFGVWRYPAGGYPLKLRNAALSVGLVVSLAPRHHK